MSDEDVTQQVLAEGTPEELRQQIDLLVKHNVEKQQQMIQESQKMMDPLAMVHARITALIQVLLDEPQQLKLEVLTQTLISTMIDNSRAQAAQESARERLLGGVPGVDPNMQRPPNPFSQG